MTIPKFDPKELQEAARIPGMFGNPDVIVYSFPVTPKEGYAALYRGKPIDRIFGGTDTAEISTPRRVR